MMNNLDNTDWHSYKKEVLILSGSLVFALAVLAISWVNYQHADEERLTTSQQYRQLKVDVSDAAQGKSLLKEVGVSFKHLKSQGFYGDEDRLVLTETLKEVADKLKLPSFKYAISPQQRIENVGSGFSGNLALLESVVSFEGGLPHEGDFEHIVNELASFAEGAFIVNSCLLVREPSLTLFEIAKNVEVACKLSFYTVKASEYESDDTDIDLGDEI